MSAWRVADVSVVAGEPVVPRWRVAEVAVATTLPAVPRWRVAGVDVTVTPAVTLEPFPVRSVDPFDTVTVTTKTVGDTVPDAFVWRVISGGATLTGSGASRTFRAPATRDGVTVVVGIIASSGGVAAPEVRAQFTVLPHNTFRVAIDGSLIAAPLPGRPVTA